MPNRQQNQPLKLSKNVSFWYFVFYSTGITKEWGRSGTWRMLLAGWDGRNELVTSKQAATEMHSPGPSPVSLSERSGGQCAQTECLYLYLISAESPLLLSPACIPPGWTGRVAGSSLPLVRWTIDWTLQLSTGDARHSYRVSELSDQEF